MDARQPVRQPVGTTHFQFRDHQPDGGGAPLGGYEGVDSTGSYPIAIGGSIYFETRNDCEPTHCHCPFRSSQVSVQR